MYSQHAACRNAISASLHNIEKLQRNSNNQQQKLEQRKTETSITTMLQHLHVLPKMIQDHSSLHPHQWRCRNIVVATSPCFIQKTGPAISPPATQKTESLERLLSHHFSHHCLIYLVVPLCLAVEDENWTPSATQHVSAFCVLPWLHAREATTIHMCPLTPSHQDHNSRRISSCNFQGILLKQNFREERHFHGISHETWSFCKDNSFWSMFLK